MNEDLGTKIIQTFSNSCFLVSCILLVISFGYEAAGENGIFLAYRALYFTIYGIFALGLYKIILLLTQLIGEMKFFRHHYILKDTKTARALERCKNG